MQEAKGGLDHELPSTFMNRHDRRAYASRFLKAQRARLRKARQARMRARMKGSE